MERRGDSGNNTITARKLIIGVGVVAIAAVAGWFGFRPRSNSLPSESIAPSKDTNTGLAPTDLNVPPSAEPTTMVPPPPEQKHNNGNTITNGMTGAVFELKPDPEGRGRQCGKLGVYTKFNKQDIDGLAVALGPNPGSYVDISGGDVYTASGVKIGSFFKSALPDNAIFGLEPPETIVCAN